MKKLFYSLALLVGGVQIAAPTVAAPMDAFLSANQSSTPGEVQVEAAYDLVNSTIDVFNFRNSSSGYSGTNVGDYHGGHLRAGVAITPRLWIDGAFWRRNIQYSGDIQKINTWQLAGQYKVFDGIGYEPSIALRAGAWGNYADQLTKTSPTTLSGATLSSLTVSKPKDVQYQLDLIGTSKVFEHTELTLFGGVGASRVTINSVNGTANFAGCNYNIAFGETETVGTLAQMCNASIVIDRFALSNAATGYYVNKETQYNATFYHAGANVKWHSDNWQLRAGYQYQYINRDYVDDVVKSRGGKIYQSNHILMADVIYKLFANTSIFVRGQYMTNQFTGEIPFAYNTLTASKFNNRYGIVSTGLIVTF
ncbi:hypothetical protein [Glaciimonas immobilis]|uniref:Porin n=1 Tax=Glaciimonas immobilis TaxID=728004 RepID=A0A840RT58_9BURK|nr:hypothetical protein [Glaciimonas immobilis]KAF3996618.1 hypothetical protein HAV38_18485 [Glaciimonas immobilis]MBB5201005.1 hypothetical protein [Glaciimonas immobilis]